MADVKVVAPMNMGQRLDYNEQQKRYNVNVDDLIKRIEALENQAVIKPINIAEKVNDGGVLRVFNLDTDIKGFGFKPFYGNIIVNLSSTPTSDTLIQHGSGIQLDYPCFVKGMSARQPDQLSVGTTTSSGYNASDFIGP